MKVYIAGKITGDPNYREKLAEAAEKIKDCGNIPLNPAELPAGMATADYMRICFAMIDTADEVCFLPDWENSRGALIEMDYCRYVRKAIFYVREGGKNTSNSAPYKAHRTLRDFLKEGNES